MMGDLGLPGSVAEMTDEAPQRALWEVRKAGLNIMMSLKGDGKPVSFIEDCAVPLEHLAEYTDALTEVFARHGTRGTWYAHASVGTLHVRPILDMRRDGAAKMRAIAEEASQLVRRFRGAYSGEHGDGLCRGEWIEWQFGAQVNAAFRAIKRHLDPANLLNPGRIVDPPRMDDARLFRYAPGYRTIELKPVFDWSAWDVQNDPTTEATTAPGTGGDATGGFAKAVEMCNNNGHCRKFDAGTMCPSYRVTRDEQHSTRGRANTLRLALSGQLDGEGLASGAVREALDLCVGCKGCKRECPTGVDMTRMKLEFAAHDRARHGSALRDRLVAALPDYAPAASRIAWLLNLRNRLPLLARLGEGMFGLSARRSLPRWRGDTFWRGAGRLLRDARRAARRGEAGRAVRRHLQRVFRERERARRGAAAAGRRLHGACGTRRRWRAVLRAHPPRGRRFAAAKAKARALLDALLPFAERGIAIVGLEPSCLLTLRDEMLAMGLGEAARKVAAQALLLGGISGAGGAGRPFCAAVQACDAADPRPWPLPPEGVRRHAAAARGAAPDPGRRADADRELVLRHGGQLRLRGRAPCRVDADGRTQPAARRARRARGDDRGRRHELPAPDRRRQRARRAARGARARGAPGPRRPQRSVIGIVTGPSLTSSTCMSAPNSPARRPGAWRAPRRALFVERPPLCSRRRAGEAGPVAARRVGGERELADQQQAAADVAARCGSSCRRRR